MACSPRITTTVGFRDAASMARLAMDAYGWRDARPECGFALDWLDLDDDELADTLASATDDILALNAHHAKLERLTDLPPCAEHSLSIG